MKILIDTYGADKGLSPLVQGAKRALAKRDFIPTFIGNKEEILREINEEIENYEIIETDNFITNNEDPVRAIRREKTSSLVLGLERLKDESYHGLLSAGSTGALLAGGLFISKRIKGIDRAALASSLPSTNTQTLLMDTGANMDCKPIFLKEFALMGKIYLENVLNIENPKIALLNVGVEEHKGNKLSKETYTLLKESKLNFIGNIEARELFTTDANIILADGFAGNVAIKSAEGALSLMNDKLKEVFYKSFKNKLAAAMIKADLKDMIGKFSADEVGGAPLLGVKEYIYKAHGSSNEIAIENALYGLMDYIDTRVIEKIEGELNA